MPASGDKESQPHPMVPVSDAIRTVLEQTVLRMISSQLSTTSPTTSIQTISVGDAVSFQNSNDGTTNRADLLSKVLASDVVMQEPGYPPYNASIMDGYAIRTTASNRDEPFAVIQKVYAGDRHSVPNDTDKNTAVYVTTGAVVPDGYDCVIPMEQVKLIQHDDPDHNNTSTTTKFQISTDNDAGVAVLEPNKWIRPIGCDIPPGTVVLPKGHVLDAVALGLLLQSGVQDIEIVAPPAPIRVGVLSTGNELLSMTASNATEGDDAVGGAVGKIPDVNRPILLNLLASFSASTSATNSSAPSILPIDLGIVRDDDLDRLQAVLTDATKRCDVVITTGGISMGESDRLEHVLVDKMGAQLHFGRLHMKPGKPTTFLTHTTTVTAEAATHHSTPSTTLVFCMPGNPVSATVCTYLLVQPCLQLLLSMQREGIALDDSNSSNADVHGESTKEWIYRIVENARVLHPEITATLGHAMKLDKERPEYHRVVLQTQPATDHPIATSTGVQRSSRLMSLRDAQGLLLLPQGVPGGKMMAEAGEEYTVLLLNNTAMSQTLLHPLVQVCDSKHLNRKAHKSFRIAVLRVQKESSDNETGPPSTSLSDLADTTRRALSGTKSGPADIISVSSTSLSRPIYDDACAAAGGSADVIVVVVAASTPFRQQLDVSHRLRERLTKGADALAMQARRGAIAEDATSGLFETVVGLCPETTEQQRGGAILICVSEKGLYGGLSNVRGLLKHALQAARGTTKTKK